MAQPKFEIVTTTAGAVSIRNIKLNEIMHNPVGPRIEAYELYVKQSNLERNLTLNIETELVIYDVGLGAAANALAALQAIKKSKRPVRIISFEIDLELLQFALEHSPQLDYLDADKAAVEILLRDNYYESGNFKWHLYHGDFINCIDKVEHKCDFIYYDPYSPKVDDRSNEAMWTTACFKKLRAQCNPQAQFFNYSQATSIRVALLEAGFYVGFGVATGLKSHTTVAAMRLEDLLNPLDRRWLERWSRSSNQLPIGCIEVEALKAFILNHIQFKTP